MCITTKLGQPLAHKLCSVTGFFDNEYTVELGYNVMKGTEYFVTL